VCQKATFFTVCPKYPFFTMSQKSLFSVCPESPFLQWVRKPYFSQCVRKPHFSQCIRKQHFYSVSKSHNFLQCGLKPYFFLKRLPGVGSEPGSSRIHLFRHFHHFTAEPQRLPESPIFYGARMSCVARCGDTVFCYVPLLLFLLNKFWLLQMSNICPRISGQAQIRWQLNARFATGGEIKVLKFLGGENNINEIIIFYGEIVVKENKIYKVG
jgi:hypothetical protein